MPRRGLMFRRKLHVSENNKTTSLTWLHANTGDRARKWNGALLRFLIAIASRAYGVHELGIYRPSSVKTDHLPSIKKIDSSHQTIRWCTRTHWSSRTKIHNRRTYSRICDLILNNSTEITRRLRDVYALLHYTRTRTSYIVLKNLFQNPVENRIVVREAINYFILIFYLLDNRCFLKTTKSSLMHRQHFLVHTVRKFK